MTESPAKRQKLDGPLIGTHNGHFHADEALAVYLLRLLPNYANSPLVRTRDPSILNSCHTVVDVGGEYDASRNRFDHHQREFTTTFPARRTRLSSAGLVYMHFGKDIIAQQTGLNKESEDVNVLYEKMYSDLIEAFDANDNGIAAYDTSALKAADITKKFEDRGFSIASVVSRYNYMAKGTEPDPAKSKEELQAEEDARFLKASAFTGEQFAAELADKYQSWLPARAKVHEAFSNRTIYHASGNIMVLSEGLPWVDHLYALETATSTSTENQVLYVLFPEGPEPDSKWRIRSVSVEGGGFDNRKDLPDAWKGMRDEKLDEISGIKGCVFVHASGFIGGNKTFDGALEMARKAIEL
ncbi:MYG1 protein-like protein [Patellaria atrata CBS 101060]|uniref:MYG1 protein-like protein n=1 Tax=Patellaria atrata CBS 101060 TaxID=1346257 RepID=A0A9P4VSK4_9PEZI|nr:MYG1 protein-like protein [Patellaria atrata CBS 101060]